MGRRPPRKPAHGGAAAGPVRIGEAWEQLSPSTARARARTTGWTTAQIHHDLHIPEGTVKMKGHYELRSAQRDCRKGGVLTQRPS